MLEDLFQIHGISFVYSGIDLYIKSFYGLDSHDSWDLDGFIFGWNTFQLEIKGPNISNGRRIARLTTTELRRRLAPEARLVLAGPYANNGYTLMLVM